jgi:hypothetical protein
MRLVLFAAMLAAAVSLAFGIGASVATGDSGGCPDHYVLTDTSAGGGAWDSIDVNEDGSVCVADLIKKDSNKDPVIDNQGHLDKKIRK